MQVADRPEKYSWLLWFLAIAAGGCALVYVLSRFMFPKTDVWGLLHSAATAGMVAGALLGLVGGFFAGRRLVVRCVLLAASPLAAFGLLLMPGLLSGQWVGILLWWSGAAAVVISGLLAALVGQQFRRWSGKARGEQ